MGLFDGGGDFKGTNKHFKPVFHKCSIGNNINFKFRPENLCHRQNVKAICKLDPKIYFIKGGQIKVISKLVGLVEVWLKDNCFYVSIDGNNSLLYDLLLGMVKGSVLGPMLYTIFISPLFDLEDLSAFADDNYTIKWHQDLEIEKSEIQASLNNIVSWLTSSGLKVNEAKTEICLFSRSNMEPVKISISGQEVQSKSQIKLFIKFV